VIWKSDADPTPTVSVAAWALVKPLRVVLLLIVSTNVPEGVVAALKTVRIDVPAPPDIVDELKVAPIPAELASAGIVTPSFTKPVKPAFGATVTATALLPGEGTETVVMFNARL
jgi:hypothetical protein